MRARPGSILSPFRSLDTWRIRTAQAFFPDGCTDPDLVGQVNQILQAILTDGMCGDAAGSYPESAHFSPSVVAWARHELRPVLAGIDTKTDPGALYETVLARPVFYRSDGKAGLQQGIRRSRGAYYTPRVVIDYILSAAFRAVNAAGISRNGLRICDPACGCGFFLSAAKEILAASSAPHQRPAAAFSSLYGIDLDPLAARIARLRLRGGEGGADASDLRYRVVTGDALVGEDCDRIVREHTRPFRWQREFSEVFQEGGFAIVCGNPPWGSQGLRGAARFPGPIEQYLRRRYPRSAEYKLNTASLFLDKGISLLRDGGVCGFIIPDSLLIGKYAARLRSLILDTCRILEIVLIGRDFWQGATPGRSAILILQKEPDPDRRKSNQVTAAFAPSLDSLGKESMIRHQYPQMYFATVPFTRFRLHFTPESMMFVRQMESGSVPLHTLATLHTGVRSRIGRTAIVSPWWRGPGWFPAVTSGSEVTPYTLCPKGSYIHVQPDLLWGGGWDPTVIPREKLIVRQTGDRIIASHDRQGHYHLNNCHSLVPVGDHMPLLVLLALLNSQALNCYYQLISLERGRPLAQVDIDLMRELPICSPASDYMQDICSHVKRIQLCAAKIQAAPEGSAAAAQWKQELKAEDAILQQMVNNAYGVTEEMTRIAERIWDIPRLPSTKNVPSPSFLGEGSK
ncbi:MAG: N-6 DNA methylase [Methanomicrobiales archaeon]|nr:N-6 DNA methylase [Methanomicrobiales archaeon]